MTLRDLIITRHDHPLSAMPIEPAHLSFEPAGSSMHGPIPLGHVCAPPRAAASDVFVLSVAPRLYPGRNLLLCIALSPSFDHPLLCVSDTLSLLKSVADHVQVTLAVRPPPDVALWITAAAPVSSVPHGSMSLAVCCDVRLKRVDVYVTLAVGSAPAWADLLVSRVSLHGSPVPGPRLPLRSRITLTAPLVPQSIGVDCGYASITPCFSSDGTLFVPAPLNPRVPSGGGVLVFAADGRPLPPVPASTLGTSTYVVAAAVGGGDGGTLFVVGADGLAAAYPGSREPRDDNGASVGPVLVALDLTTGQRLWDLPVDGDGGIALAQDVSRASVGDPGFHENVVVVGGIKRNRSLYVGGSDGTVLSSIALAQFPLGFAVYNEDLFYNCLDGVREISEGSDDLFRSGPGDGAPSGRRALVVVPPRGPGLPRHLVFAAHGCSVLTIVAISKGSGSSDSPSPGTRLRTHELKGVAVVGLAADSGGTALAVCDAASGQVLVLPWPLPA